MGVLRIALLCIVFGAVSIPFCFSINPNPVVVWAGNGLGSWLSAMLVLYVGERINSGQPNRFNQRRIGRKVSAAFEEGGDNAKVKKAGGFINRHGLRIFAFLCPIFPGVLVGTVAVFLLDLDKLIYKRWLSLGIFFASGAYVFSYWLAFVK